jgi:inner membrane transporter RhtA
MPVETDPLATASEDRPGPARTSRSGVLMVSAAVMSVQLGAAFAKLIFDRVGPSGVVLLRLLIASLLLLAATRPRIAGRSRRDWAVVVAFGSVLATMNLCFYQAVDRLPLGMAVTIELLGPLGLAVVLSRRAQELAWVALAVVGVVLLGGGSRGLDLVGVGYALAAAACWAAYILLSAEAGRRFARVDGLSLAMAVGAVVALPFGIAAGGRALLSPTALLVGAVVALLSSTVNYSLELAALRRVPARAFGVLMSLSPVAATLAGFLVLDQRLTVVELLAVACVIAASAGTVLTPRRPLG